MLIPNLQYNSVCVYYINHSKINKNCFVCLKSWLIHSMSRLFIYTSKYYYYVNIHFLDHRFILFLYKNSSYLTEIWYRCNIYKYIYIIYFYISHNIPINWMMYNILILLFIKIVFGHKKEDLNLKIKVNKIGWNIGMRISSFLTFSHSHLER